MKRMMGIVAIAMMVGGMAALAEEGAKCPATGQCPAGKEQTCASCAKKHAEGCKCDKCAAAKAEAAKAEAAKKSE